MMFKIYIILDLPVFSEGVSRQLVGNVIKLRKYLSFRQRRNRNK